MTRARYLPILAAALLVGLPACRMNERLSGTIMSGVGGAALGAATGGVGGAFIGGGAGALTGYLVGDYIADQRERGRPSVFGDVDDGPGGAQYASAPQEAPDTIVMGKRDSAADLALARGKASRSAAEAKHWFEEALRADPRHAPSWNALGLAAVSRQDWDDAERCFRSALAADPANTDARHYLARLAATPR